MKGVQMSTPLTEEEKLVAELELLDIRYLSRQAAYRAERVRPPENLLADLVRQPSARVRSAVIAVLLTHPEYADAVPVALQSLPPLEQWTLRFFYTAAVFLQQTFAEPLRKHLATRWKWLPALFADELGVSKEGTPREWLVQLGREHERRTQMVVNWVGTYEDVVRRLLRQWELEQQWNQ
jgi:hypothetical protein